MKSYLYGILHNFNWLGCQVPTLSSQFKKQKSRNYNNISDGMARRTYLPLRKQRLDWISCEVSSRIVILILWNTKSSILSAWAMVFSSIPEDQLPCVWLLLYPFRNEPTLSMWCAIFGTKFTWFGSGHPLVLQDSEVGATITLYTCSKPARCLRTGPKFVLTMASLYIAHLSLPPCAVFCVAYKSFLFKSFFALSLSGKPLVLL